MSVKVLVADDSAVMRRAIKSFLESRSEIELVGEAEGLPEAISKSSELHPEVIVLDLHLPENFENPASLKSVLGGARLVAVTFAPDESAKELAEMVGAEKLIDKMDLVADLIPAILGTSENQRSEAQRPQSVSERSRAMPE